MLGKTISHYKVIEKIGEGGMGEVYRAEDTNLSREVAIKVLPEQFTQDPQRLARFEREAKLLASLNHPNIAAIYGFEHSDEVHFLVLELVPGETLAEKVAKGPLPVEEALELCRQIAEGVEAAHEKGVIHRDLKPANVKVTPEGKVKILDFGLAKAFEAETPVTDISQSPTLTEEMTRAGVILGTAAYMSPEQAKGEAVDKRTDIFAFGCVLYELLTSKRTFDGKTITETLGAIIHKEPDWEALPASVSSTIRFLLGRCLQKDSHRRLQHIDGARLLIEEALSGATTASAIGLDVAPQPARWKLAIPWSITVAVATVAALALWNLTGPVPQSVSPPSTHFVISPPPTAPLGDFGGNDLAISPDGRRIVYLARLEGRRQIYLRSLDELVAIPIPGTENAGNPIFSPDGNSVAFFTAGKLQRVSLDGGTPITVCDTPFDPGSSGSWGPDGTIVFWTPTLGLSRVSASGGQPESLVKPDPDQGEASYTQPVILPGGKAVLFTVQREDFSVQISVLSLETGEKKILVEGASHSHYLPTGHLLYLLQGTENLLAVPFDLERLEITGDSTPILQGVRRAATSYADYAVSENGTLAYVPGGVGSQERRSLVWVDREGQPQSLTETERRFSSPSLSPDGERLAVTADWDVWVYEMARGILTPLTFGSRVDRSPIWAPDSKRLTFSVHDSGIFWIAADGSGEAEQLTQSRNLQIPNSWSPDGVLAYSEGLPESGDLWVLPLEEERKPQEFLVTEFNERHPMFSPNGRWIAFTSDRSGQDEIYVKPYPTQGGLVQISPDGGREPVWARDGKELFYRNIDQMMVVSVQTEPTFTAERPRVLFEGSYIHSQFDWASNYDISPDGERFLMIKQAEVQTQINVVLNWFEELKRLVPSN